MLLMPGTGRSWVNVELGFGSFSFSRRGRDRYPLPVVPGFSPVIMWVQGAVDTDISIVMLSGRGEMFYTLLLVGAVVTGTVGSLVAAFLRVTCEKLYSG